MKLTIIRELIPYKILIILILTCKFASSELYLFWQQIIDNFILLLLLISLLIDTKNWHWFSKRIVYSLLFLLILNTYAKLFGLESKFYISWYITPLISMVSAITICSVIEIGYKLYRLWKNGKTNMD